MTHYLTEQTCRIEKKHYSVLLHFVQNWEDRFWNDEKEEQRELAFSAKAMAGLQFFRALNPIAANTLDHLYRKELSGLNPMLAWNTELATQEMREQAELSLKQKLDDEPELLFSTAPELRRRLDVCEAQFTEMMDEMLSRIAADRAEISRVLFGGQDMGKILSFDGSGADSHNHGRFACIVTAERGKFLYKPRSMRADVLLYDMTQRLFADTVVLPRTLDFGRYGYAEFIRSAPAEGAEAAAAFFRRMGGVCALYQVFGSTDFHMENMLSVGEYPALVDLETFLGTVVHTQAQNAFFPLAEEDAFLADYINSVAFSCVLPHRANEKEHSPLLCRGERSILPLVDGERVDVREYFEEFSDGFREIYHRCMEQRVQLLAYVDQLSGCVFRCLLRNTDNYAKLLQEYYSVRILQSDEAAMNLTDVLRKALGRGVNDRQSAQNSAVAEFELAAMAYGDVPLFLVHADSPALYAGDTVVAEDFFDSAVADRVRGRIARLCEADCGFELDIIRRGMETAHVAAAENPRNVRLGVCHAGPFTSFADEAQKVFEDLWNKRVVSPSGKLGWLDHREDSSSFGFLSLDYGMGQGGIAALAAEYYAVTGDERAAEIVRTFMDGAICCVRRLKTADSIFASPGDPGITGIGGAVKAMLLAADAMDRAEYRDCAIDFISLLPKAKLDEVDMPDYYAGLSGILYVLCSSPAFRTAENFKDAVRTLTDRLLSLRTLETTYGIQGWDCIKKGRPISGLGHGTAGIGLALASALRVFPDDEKLREAVCAAFDLEHAMYSEKLQTWPDFRASGVAASFMHGFCSGAPGMGMVYLKMHENGVDTYDNDMERAIQKCLVMGEMAREHYCCGNPAAIEFLMEAGRVLKRPELTEAGLNRLRSMCMRASSRGEYVFLPDRYENFAPVTLLNGLPGVIHVLLKADHPELSCLLL